MRIATVIFTNCLHGSGRVSLVCATAGLPWFTAFVKRTVSVSNLCWCFSAVLSNYNGMTAYICRRFMPTTAFLVLLRLRQYGTTYVCLWNFFLPHYLWSSGVDHLIKLRSSWVADEIVFLVCIWFQGQLLLVNLRSLAVLLTVIMVALCNRADHYIFALWFLSSFFFPSPNLSGRRLDVYHTSAHGVALVRI